MTENIRATTVTNIGTEFNRPKFSIQVLGLELYDRKGFITHLGLCRLQVLEQFGVVNGEEKSCVETEDTSAFGFPKQTLVASIG